MFFVLQRIFRLSCISAFCVGLVVIGLVSIYSATFDINNAANFHRQASGHVLVLLSCSYVLYSPPDFAAAFDFFLFYCHGYSYSRLSYWKVLSKVRRVGWESEESADNRLSLLKLRLCCICVLSFQNRCLYYAVKHLFIPSAYLRHRCFSFLRSPTWNHHCFFCGFTAVALLGRCIKFLSFLPFSFLFWQRLELF